MDSDEIILWQGHTKSVVDRKPIIKSTPLKGPIGILEDLSSTTSSITQNDFKAFFAVQWNVNFGEEHRHYLE